jgi:nicotinamidase/pyrazinamidase
MLVQETDALLIVDVQNTFCPGGTLPVTGGDTVIPPINALLPLFAGRVYASQDWHPAEHCSFGAQGGIWPPHAIAHTDDAALHPSLNLDGISHIVQKGTQTEQDAYSAFDGTGLAQILRDAGIRRVFVTGLATDYCVKASALDAIKAGFEVVGIEDAMRAVDVNPGDGEAAIQSLRDAGATFITSGEIASP